jgi:hypothetical protein
VQPIYLRNLQEVIGQHYPNDSAAARALGVSPSNLFRVLKGERPATKVVGRLVENLKVPLQADQPALVANVDARPRLQFRFDESDPADMVAQLEDWFGQLPTDTPLRARVVRGVLRALFDELFTVQRPTENWRFVMAQVDGFADRSSGRASA